jgi:hypothetical protein
VAELAPQTRSGVIMFGFFNKKKEERQAPPPPPRRDDAMSRTVDLVQATGDCAKADGDGMILMFRSGILQPQQFFPGFVKSEVFILVKYLNNLNAPLFLSGADGAPRLAVFTSPERAKAMQEKHPEYRYAVKAPCQQILSGVAPGTGLVMNPGSEAVTFQMAPEQFERFKLDFVQAQN